MNLDSSATPERHDSGDREVEGAETRDSIRPEAETSAAPRRRPRLVVENVPTQSASEAEGLSPRDGPNGGASLPAPVATPEPEAALVRIPSELQLMQALELAQTPVELAELERMAAAYLDVSRRCNVVASELSKLTKFRLLARHKLGQVIPETVWVGRRPKDSQPGSGDGRLPDNLSKAEAKRCRDLARIPAGVLEAYFASVDAKGLIPTEVGAHKYSRANGVDDACATPEPSRQVRRPKVVRSEEARFAPALLGAVRRVLGDVDVCVGDPGIPCRRKLAASTLKVQDVRGVVFVADCVDPEHWLPKLAALHDGAKVSAVLVALPCRPWEPWFRAVVDSSPTWEWCIVTGDEPSVLVAYLGQNTQGFRLVFRELGAVLASPDGRDQRR